MKEIEEVKKKTFESNVGKNIVIEYRVNYDIKSGQVDTIYGVIEKDGAKVGSFSFESKTKDLHRTYSPYDGISLEERQATDQTINKDLNEIFTSK